MARIISNNGRLLGTNPEMSLMQIFRSFQAYAIFIVVPTLRTRYKDCTPINI